ncbi:MAG: hypothetical protein KF716_24330 [Anaerolineae bacterium]|nr:hypothetical protein [Anaerolineae bacterium]
MTSFITRPRAFEEDYMQHSLPKRPLFFVSFGIFLFLVGAVIWLLTPVPVEAQCGSQASSCKNCHEVQAKDPVNQDGTGWHESHAFGDFCVFCHAGNQQATDKDESHVGMVPPLSDVKSACAACHADDLQARADVYAKVLNVDLNSAAATTPEANAAVSQPAATTAPVATQPPANVEQPATSNEPAPELVVNDPNVTDYVQRYNEIVLGERPTNWGNIIVAALIGLLAVGGGGFVFFNEMRLSHAATVAKQVEGEYPADVVDMLPAITALKPQSRLSLTNILKHPQKSDKVLGAIDSLVSDDKAEE